MHSFSAQLPTQKQACGQQFLAPSSICRRPANTTRFQCQALAATATRGPVKESAGVSYQGTARKRNEDRYALQVEGSDSKLFYAGVFDGHGGTATSEWLEQRMEKWVDRYWQGQSSSAESDITDAFIKAGLLLMEADEKLLAPKSGFFGGLGERGIGGSKCGSTGVVAIGFKDGGKMKLLAANVGDARAVLSRKGKAMQLTIDHVPDSALKVKGSGLWGEVQSKDAFGAGMHIENDEERIRIEAKNPNPKMPLVRYVGGTWRVGGILALSRAFGDAYMKSSLQFEGLRASSDGYSSGFGVIAEPDTSLVDITGDDQWLILASDGLFANEERGGGGGLENQEVVDVCNQNSGLPAEKLAQKLVLMAQEAGSTDDITVVILKLK